MRLYETLANDIAALIRDGTLLPGQRVPSVRQLTRERNVSAASVTRGYELLEARGYLEARARSGFFVAERWRETLDRPRATRTPRAVHLDISELVFEVLEAMRARDIVPLGSAFPSPRLFPLKLLARQLGASARRLDAWSTIEDLPPGNLALRRQIAQRYRVSGAQVSAEEIVITSGALEALNLSLQSVTAPNDIVAVEAPTFYGCLQAIESSGRRAVEVPTHPRDGLDLTALARVLERQPVRACWFMTTFQNPLGVTVAPQKKQQLVQMLAARDIPLIEDNVYADLYLQGERPPSAKTHDHRGLVLDCGSFSKTLAPGYRLGWVAAGRFASAVWRRKVMGSLATSIPIQAVIADYLAKGTFERHLRGLRRAFATQQASLIAALGKYFPPETQWFRPSGGYLLWVRLPAGVDAIELHRLALEHGISVAPGPIFSARREFADAIRLNYGHPWTTRLEAAVKTLGRLVREQMTAPSSRRHHAPLASRP